MISEIVNNRKLFEELKEYTYMYFSKTAMDMIEKNEDMTGMHKAYTIFEKAFKQMEIDFLPKDKTKFVDHSM